MRAVLLAGGGDFRDPWHPFAATADRVAGILRETGIATEVVDSVAGLTRAAPDADLLVLVAGSELRPTPHDDALVGIVRAHQAAGRPVLAFHISVALAPGRPEWADVLGGRWVEGASGHPPEGPSVVHVATDAHPVTRGIADFTVVDERYTGLEIEAGIVVLAEHEERGERHPLVWAWRAAGGARVVVDALGHSHASFDAAEHRALVRQAARWLVSGDGETAADPGT